ncbi:tyrosine-type recombinase/integrase [Clostridium tyrobutyricum]|uniref:tyrosine-type recombinase/integrase n=1 Tax=Clostridium tyrobutyricum TaxID=1519 RepID=UPI001C384266|nr:site-specific integrase [Clostridium tyrobutyricum]MBV4426488.1 site-specific integrase [Clostridium tyrobutyricum]MBV4436723.1 site-specific integrase [Clostridium tyrobutyricum]MBV4439412.1 site-specific integrase [Clostridium tyrobutyricum]
MRGSVRKKGGRWYYSFEIGRINGKRKRVEHAGGSTKSEAETALRKALNEFEKCGSTIQESNISVSDYFDYWYKEYVLINLKYNTQQNYKRIIDKHIKPSIGKYRLKLLNPNILQNFLNNKRIEGYSKNSISGFYGLLSGALKYAVHPGQFIKESPMIYVKMPRFNNIKNEDNLKIITLEQFNTIVNRFPKGSNFYIPLQIAFNTGMRAAEVCGLTWDCVDLENKTIKVEKILIGKGKGIWEFGTPKTKSSCRTICIGETLVKILSHHKTWQKQNKLKYGKYYKKSNFVCTKENGKNITTDSLKYLSRVVNYELHIRFNFHSLRHTHATMLLESGANIKDIQERLGHSNLATTMDTYSHVTKKMKNDTVDILENMLSKKLPTT